MDLEESAQIQRHREPPHLSSGQSESAYAKDELVAENTGSTKNTKRTNSGRKESVRNRTNSGVQQWPVL